MLSALGATMAMDHRLIAALIDELEQEVSGPLNSDWRELVRRLLYGLHSLLELHCRERTCRCGRCSRRPSGSHSTRISRA